MSEKVDIANKICDNHNDQIQYAAVQGQSTIIYLSLLSPYRSIFLCAYLFVFTHLALTPSTGSYHLQ